METTHNTLSNQGAALTDNELLFFNYICETLIQDSGWNVQPGISTWIAAADTRNVYIYRRLRGQYRWNFEIVLSPLELCDMDDFIRHFVAIFCPGCCKDAQTDLLNKLHLQCKADLDLDLLKLLGILVGACQKKEPSRFLTIPESIQNFAELSSQQTC